MKRFNKLKWPPKIQRATEKLEKKISKSSFSRGIHDGKKTPKNQLIVETQFSMVQHRPNIYLFTYELRPLLSFPPHNSAKVMPLKSQEVSR